jgi:autotransporter-associated beta strand protein
VGGLTKLGAGVLTLSGNNINSGTTTITAGAITIPPGGGLADSSTLVVDGGLINIPDAGQIEIVAGLTIGDGPALPDGDYTQASNPEAISGAGILRVQPFAGTGYDIWSAGAGLTLGVNDGPEEDVEPSGPDGIANVLEYILGGDPLSSDPEILPQGVINGDNYEFTFNRADDSELDTTQTFQWSTDMETWNSVTVGAGNSGPDGNGVSVTVIEGEPATTPDVVTVSVPTSNADAAGKIFARLQATKP